MIIKDGLCFLLLPDNKIPLRVWLVRVANKATVFFDRTAAEEAAEKVKCENADVAVLGPYDYED
jgi:hypothetical protein